MENNKTHWKKNNDSRYISGEDLHAALKGLRPEMVVTIINFKDAQTFDQKNQQDITKTGLFLQELNGKQLYKPVILNNTNAKFLIKEFGSEYIEDWFGKPFVLYAHQDRRHGYVARFKKYYPNQAAPKPAPEASEEDVNLTIEQIELITELPQLGDYWKGLPRLLQAHPKVIKAKDDAKVKLTPPQQ